ncbi:winged helix-turn-helix domain-containing protein [Rhizobium johnstonii]|uniref:ATP-binding protein n=1 Tax=Rhizobium TaxID=379 RepID=UPI00102FE375|nr:winged helix-turn-helix domain-containing protein [Rhizobium leguminosarum]TBF69519.1 transcriptional regulator [Rhizobium leguminosarum]TBG96583.1 transcriptional regulator [Rhizobium leguminosarum]TBG99664.1 transcriptional regulator [Rhizobium leguminosarum]TBH31041.1 transcriptional regulator [Rhizobium leguminosarum]TBH47224.1 transcriptional regulator [Rhizobium leguminosarum]
MATLPFEGRVSSLSTDPSQCHSLANCPEAICGLVRGNGLLGAKRFMEETRKKCVVYSFGAFRLYPERQLLVRNGEPVKLGGRAFELLHLLVRRNGEIVSKEDLTAAAWPGVFVHESNLKVNLHSLRRSINDIQKLPDYIVTIPGRGYRFIAQVEVGFSDDFDLKIPLESPPPSPLPTLGSVVGRDREVAHLTELVLGDHSLVTVVGAAGVGKTTVAISASMVFAERRSSDVCFVDLSKIEDPSIFPSALAAALGLRGELGDPLIAVCDYLRQRPLLLLLDNCEHVLSAVTVFASKLRTKASRCKLLVTSREPLRIPSEHVYVLNSLAVPEDATQLTAERVLSFPAVELFLQRAAEWTGYQLSDGDSETIAKICRALDGLPLALELAAANLEQATPATVLATLDEFLDFRIGNARPDAPDRHETLHAAIDWSFSLLSRTEATVFCMASVFADSFELEDGLAVAGSLGLTALDVIAALGTLVGKSLITAQVSGPGLRYRLLDSTRRYGARRLRAEGLDTRCRRAHAERMLRVFEQSGTEWGWRQRGDWSRSYVTRLADLRSALLWAFGDDGNAQLGIELTAASLPLWFESSLVAEARTRVETALAVAETNGCDPLPKAKLSLARGWSMMFARPYTEEMGHVWLSAFEYAREAGSIEFQLQALVGLAYFTMDTGSISRAIVWLEEFRGLAERHHCHDFDPECESAMAWARGHAGQMVDSVERLEKLAHKHVWANSGPRKTGLLADRTAGITGHIPFFAWIKGRVDYAAALASETLAAAEREGYLMSQSNVLAQALCPVAHFRGDLKALASGVSKLRSILEMENIGVWVPVQGFFAAALDDLQGDDSAEARMRGAIDDFISSRFVLRLPGLLGTLAEVYLKKEKLDLASDALDLAEAYDKRQGELWSRPELRRLRARYCAQIGETARAEQLYMTALQEARSSGARSYELRTAADLAGHLNQSGRFSAASELLGPVVQSFKEGFQTRDYLSASEVLKQAIAGAKS